MGCGGSASIEPRPAPALPGHYTVDPGFTPISFGNFITGLDNKGNWIGINDLSTNPAECGYTVNGAFTAFPQTGVPSDSTAIPISAGGPYVWATYRTSLRGVKNQNFVEILNRSTGSIVRVPNYTLPNFGCVSPDGNSTMAIILGPYLVPNQLAIIYADGEVSPIPMPSTIANFEPWYRSNTGYTAGVATTITYQTTAFPRSVRYRLLHGEKPSTTEVVNYPYGVISPVGDFVQLQGKYPNIMALAEDGSTCGWDALQGGVDIAARWDKNGHETLLQRYDASDLQEIAYGISKEGYCIGEAFPRDTFRPTVGLIWAPNGSVTAISAKLAPANSSLTISGGIAMQSVDKILAQEGTVNLDYVCLVGSR